MAEFLGGNQGKRGKGGVQMSKIRVMVVDDAVVIRRVLTDLLSSDPELEVVATAPNGKVALSKLTNADPDVMILDVDMPEMNGIETLTELRKLRPRMPVIMFSSLTTRGASVTLDALALGATDYVPKPASFTAGDESVQEAKQELITRIKAVHNRSTARGRTGTGLTQVSGPDRVRAAAFHSPSGSTVIGGAQHHTSMGGNTLMSSPPTSLGSSAPLPPPLSAGRTVAPRKGPLNRVDILAIGVSTGGPNALAEVIPELPGDLPVPVVIVQHMPPVFTKLLAERLSAKSKIPVEEGEPGAILRPGKIWIAPGNFHMIVEKDGNDIRLRTHQGPPENSCRPAVDVLFRSVGDVYGGKSLGVILTGMGSDGFKGCEQLRDLGAQILAQDEATSVVWGMPGFVARAGLADKVVPLQQMASEIVRRVSEGRPYSPR